MQLSILLQIINRPWLIEPSQADYFMQIANNIIFKGQSYPADPGVHNYFGDRIDANGVIAENGSVFLLNINGPLMKANYCGNVGMERMAQIVESATADPRIEAIIAKINSPGGTVDGTHNLARAIKASPKATVAFVDGNMCSAAYWIGSAFTEIICSDANAGYSSFIGSIGTKMTIVDTREKDLKEGYKTRDIVATKSSRKGKMLSDILAGNEDRIKRDLDNINETFLNDVKQNRAGKINVKVEDVLDGEVYNGKDAMKFGLIDKIGNFRYAVKRSLFLAKTIR